MRQYVPSNLYDKVDGFYSKVAYYFFSGKDVADKKNREPSAIPRDLEFVGEKDVRMLTTSTQFAPEISFLEALKFSLTPNVPKVCELYPEISKLCSTSIIADGSILLYVVTTAKAPEYAKVGGPGSNFITNFYVIKVFMDYALKLIKEEKYLQAAVAITAATVLYVPYMLIAIFESRYTETLTALIAIVTLLSGGGLYGYGVIDVAGLGKKIKDAVLRPAILAEDKEEEKVREIVLRNIAISKERGRFASYQEKDLSELTVDLNYDQYKTALTEKEKEEMLNVALLKIGLDFATALDVSKLTFKNSDQKWNSPGNIIHTLLQMMASIILVYGSYAYMCATEQSAREDLRLSGGLAFVFSNVILTLQYILSIKGGVELVSGISNNLMPTINNRQLPNNLKIGGALGHVAKFLSLTGAVGFSISSGYTSGELYNESCPSSMLNLMFAGAGTGTYVSSSGFNGIYNLMAFNWAIKYSTIQTAKNTQLPKVNDADLTFRQKQIVLAKKDAAYLAIQEAHKAVSDAVKAAPLRDGCRYQFKTSPLNKAEKEACGKGKLIIFEKKGENKSNEVIWFVHFQNEKNKYHTRKVVKSDDIDFLSSEAASVFDSLQNINKEDLVQLVKNLNKSDMESALTADIMLSQPDQSEILENHVIFAKASNKKWTMYALSKKPQEVKLEGDIAILNTLESKMLNLISPPRGEDKNELTPRDNLKMIAKSLGSSTPYTLNETLSNLGMLSLELKKPNLFGASGPAAINASDTVSENSMMTVAPAPERKVGFLMPAPSANATSQSKLLASSGDSKVKKSWRCAVM